METIEKVTSKLTLPLETGENVVINYTDSAKTKARVFAPLMERYATEDKNYLEMRKGITAYFYSSSGKIESSMKAKYAIRYDKEKKITAKNDVVLVNSKGDTLNTEILNWDEVTQRIHSDRYVRITTADQIIMGDGFESNTEFTKYKIYKTRGIIDLH
jgi:LPS export ABC transporter protein LptC